MNAPLTVIPAKAGTQFQTNDLPAKPAQIDHEYLRDQIEARMQAEGMTQAALARRAGIDPSTLSKGLSLDRRLDLETIEAIAAALGCSRHELTGETPPPSGIGQLIEASRLMPNPRNYRSDMDPDKLDGLMQSIVQVGLLQNITVRPDGTGSFFVVAGHRRLAAVNLAIERGLLTEPYALPCRVIDATDAEALTEALIENLHREDVHPLDEARAFEELQELNGCDAETVAGLVGKDARYVQYRLRLLEKLSPAIIESFRRNEISFTQARLLTAADHDVQETILGRLTGGIGWYRTTDDLERGVKAAQAEKERLEDARRNPPPKDEREPTIPQLSNEERAARKAAAEAEQKAQEAAMAVKVRSFNTLFRSALRQRPGTIARNALLDMMAPFGGSAMGSRVVGKLGESHLAAFCGLLGIDPPPSPESERDDDGAWQDRAVDAIKALDDHRATETLLLAIAATAAPATVQTDYGGYDNEIWHSRYTYRAEIPSASARTLAGFLGVHVPDDMLPPEPEPEDEDEDEIADEEEADDVDA